MRTTDPNTIIQQQLFLDTGGIRVPTQQFQGIYDATILDTDVTNPSLDPGMCRIVIPSLNPDTAFGPCSYPTFDAPENGQSCVVGFLYNTANTAPSIQVRILELVATSGDSFSPFLLMGA